MHRLDLAHTNADDTVAAALARCCPELRVLVVRGCNHWRAGCTAIVASGCHLLRYLDAGGTGTDSIDVAALARYCPGLLHLSLRDTSVDNRVVQTLLGNTAPSLVYLSFFSCRGMFGGEMLREFARAGREAGSAAPRLLGSLRRLDVRYVACGEDYQQSVADVMASWPALEQLSVPEEVESTPEGWAAVKFDRGVFYACVDPHDPEVTSRSPMLYIFAPPLPQLGQPWLKQYGGWLDREAARVQPQRDRK